ncbi:MAG: dipeptidase [Deltaproteobacteria bacterium]|nr:dipeptidase [Deltaproteobacteria bacterium]
MDRVLSTIRSGETKLLEELFDFLRIPSVSTNPVFAKEVEHCAEWLADVLRRAGFQSSVEPTGGHPAVLAEWRGAPGAPTVLIYGHYDVQPADPLEAWTSPPFTPTVRDGDVIARGASDDKGQVFCHVAAARAHLEVRGKLPVNLIFLVEGEEESGSTNLEQYVREHRERLACDAVIVSDSAQFAPGLPALTYGLRGLMYLEVTVTGPALDLHSGTFGGAVVNPANALAWIITRLHDEANRVAVPGFYDGVLPLQQWEREAFARLPFDEREYCRKLGLTALWGEEGYSTLERAWARPTLDVNGIWSGYTGEGSKTVLPSTASAKISCRLVPNQEPARIWELVKARLEALCPPGCTLQARLLHSGKPVLLPVDTEVARAARKAAAEAFGAEPVLIREGGSIPVVQTFQEVLGAPGVLLGFARPDDRAHGPDEKFNLADFFKGITASARLLEELGRGRG